MIATLEHRQATKRCNLRLACGQPIAWAILDVFSLLLAITLWTICKATHRCCSSVCVTSMCVCVGMHDLYIHHVTNIAIVSVCFTQKNTKRGNELLPQVGSIARLRLQRWFILCVLNDLYFHATVGSIARLSWSRPSSLMVRLHPVQDINIIVASNLPHALLCKYSSWSTNVRSGLLSEQIVRAFDVFYAT